MQIISFIVLMSITLTSFAGELGKKKEKAEVDQIIQERLDNANKACGTKITVSVDLDAFKPYLEGTFQLRSVGYFCGEVAEGIRSLCQEGEDEKKAVKEKISKIICKHKAAMTDLKFKKEGVKLEKDTVTVLFDKETGRISDFTQEYLSNAL